MSLSRDLILAVWAVVATGALFAEIAGRASRGSWATFAALIRRAARRDVLFVALFVGWMWVGWHLFAR